MEKMSLRKKIILTILLTGALIFILGGVIWKLTHPITLDIKQPSNEYVIPHCPFYVVGEIDGDVPDDARLKVEIINSNNEVERCIESGPKYNRNVDLYYDKLSYDDSDDPSRKKLLKSGMPELVLDASGSFTNGDVKATYSDKHFAALIPCEFQEESLQCVKDSPHFVDKNGNKYKDFSEGEHRIEVSIVEDGEVIARTKSKLEFAYPKNMFVCRFTPAENKTKTMEFLGRNGDYTNNDVFAGLWSTDRIWSDMEVYAHIDPEWIACDYVNFVNGPYEIMVYNLEENSTSVSLEMPQIIQNKALSNPNMYNVCYYDIGEITIKDPEHHLNLTGEIEKLEQGRRLKITRCDNHLENAEENYINLNDLGIDDTITDMSTIVMCDASSNIAVNGIVAPIQVSTDCLEFNPRTYRYKIKNKISQLKYTLTGDGINEVQERKVELTREKDGKKSTSLYEFRNLLDIREDWKNKNIEVKVDGYDSYGNYVEGTNSTFKIRVL